MATTKQYNDTIDTLDSNNTTNDVTGGASYEMAKEQKYQELLDKEISLENAKANALKYTNNTINASGFGGTGYGSTINAGIQNSYLNELNKAKTTYNQEVDAIDMQEYEANYETTMNDISSSSSVDNLQTYLSGKGYGSVDADGNFIWNAKPENISESDWNSIQNAYNNQVTNLGGVDRYTGASYQNIDDFRKANVQVGQNEQVNVGDRFSVESDSLFTNVANGNVAYNGVVKMINGDGKIMYAQYTTKGMRVVDEKTYSKAKDKYEITVTRTGDGWAWNPYRYNPNFKKVN